MTVDKNKKQKRRNRGRNKDGGVISLVCGSSSTTLLVILIISINSKFTPNWISIIPSILISIAGIAGYMVQRRNRMTREARIGLFQSSLSLVGHVAIALTAI